MIFTFYNCFLSFLVLSCITWIVVHSFFLKLKYFVILNYRFLIVCFISISLVYFIPILDFRKLSPNFVKIIFLINFHFLNDFIIKSLPIIIHIFLIIFLTLLNNLTLIFFMFPKS